MKSDNANMQILESQIRQLFAGVVWTHKIQEKQADIYRNRYIWIERGRIVASSLTTSGVLATLVMDEKWVNILTAIISVITIFLNTCVETYNYMELHDAYKKSALQFLEIREEWICLLTDIRIERVTEEIVVQRRDELLKRQIEAYKTANDAGDRAVNKASSNLKERKDNTYSDQEIDSFLPSILKKAQEGINVNR